MTIDTEREEGLSLGRRPPIFYGWYVLAASFVILFVNAGAQTIIGVMVKPMTTEFSWSRGAISSAIFLNLAVYAVATLITGRLYDRYGPKWVMAGSALLLALGYALMGTMHSLWQFFLYYGVLAAAGFGGTTVPIVGSIMGNWFEKWRGFAVGLAMAGNCMGQFVLIPAFSSMIDSSGWRNTSLWIAAICVVVNLALVFGVVRGDPDKFGLRAYGRNNGHAGHSPLAKIHAARGATLDPQIGAGATTTAGRDLTLSEAMRSRSLWLFTVVMFVCGGGDYLFTTHLVPLVTDYGLSDAVGARMLASAGLLGFAGILLAGPVADAIGNKIPIVVTFVLRAVLFAMILRFKGAASFWVFSLAMGLTLPITAPLLPNVVGKLYGVTHIGFISGFITTVHMLGGGLWSYLGGVVYDRTGDYDLAMAISAGLAVVAVICTLLMRDERHVAEG